MRMPTVFVPACAALLAAAFIAAPAAARTLQSGATAPSDISAASKKSETPPRKSTKRAAPRNTAPVATAPRVRRFNDPSFGPDGRRFQAPAYLGSCVIDDGYGRFSACPDL